ncbi:hypothetical protein FSP39_022748 [Pinctada imbricata]|uniref:Novel STAND NTPase 3 domain-containing protein n=1 Tax=Pinctada imbricata TaxID=66713 RepID=A0AA88XLA6_PINIB|nr:hypothetical protein FSP39_022748 [Pinctada imbricata]
MEILNKHGILTLIGIAGSGKTTLAKDLMKCIERTKSFTSSTITKPEEWEERMKSDSHEVILIEDIFGKINLDQQKLEMWSSHLDSMISKTASEKKIILTCRKNVKKETDKECIGIAYDKLFKADLTVNLSDKDYCMSHDEMKSLLTIHSQHNPSRKLSEQDCDKIIHTHYHEIGFPQLATLFFSSTKFKEEGVTFFQKGDITLNKEIRKFDSHENLEFSILSFMSINEDKRRSDSSDGCVSLDIENDMTEFSTFHDRMYTYDVNFVEIQQCLIEMKNTFVRESKPNTFCFQHETVYGTVLKAFGERHPKLFLEMMNGRDVWKYGRPRTLGPGSFSDLEVRFERKFYEQFASKLISFTKGDYGRLVQHRALEDKEFVPFLLDAIEHDVSKITNETMSKRSYDFILSLYNGECDGLMNSCILRLIQGKLFYSVGLNRCLSKILKGENTFNLSISTILANYIPHLGGKSMLHELIMNCSVEFIMECVVSHTDLFTGPRSSMNVEKGILFLCVDRAMKTQEWKPKRLLQHLLNIESSTLLTETDPDGCSPTAYALKTSCFSLLDIFLDHKPDIADDKNFTFSLQRCVKAKNIGLVKKIISGRPKAVDERDNNFRHPLLVAAEENEKEVFGIIWKACHSFVILDELVLDMMESIIKNGWDDNLAEIIEKNKDFKNCRSRREETPLILSAKYKQLTCITVLLEREADIYLTDKNQRSFLHFVDAPDAELLEKVFIFVEKHSGIVFVKDKNGISPLLQAVFSKRRNIAKRLFEIAKSDKERLIQDIRRKDKYDRTMLRETISNGWIDITEDIVDIDPEVVTFENIDMIRYITENAFGQKRKDLIQIFGKCI